MDGLTNKAGMIKFEVSKMQLIGAPWNSINGTMQNIRMADGWQISRPVDRLHEQENGKVAFYMAKNKKDGSVNEITMRRSVDTGETNETGKRIYKDESMKVSVEELEKIMMYGAQKYKYQKEEESGFIGMVFHKAQIVDTWKEPGRENAREYKVISIDNSGNSFLFASDKLHRLEDKEDYFRINIPLRDKNGENRAVTVAHEAAWYEKAEERRTQQLLPRKLREQSNLLCSQIEKVITEMALLGYVPSERPDTQPPGFLYWKQDGPEVEATEERKLLCTYNWDNTQEFIDEKKKEHSEPELEVKKEKRKMK